MCHWMLIFLLQLTNLASQAKSCFSREKYYFIFCLLKMLLKYVWFFLSEEFFFPVSYIIYTGSYNFKQCILNPDNALRASFHISVSNAVNAIPLLLPFTYKGTGPPRG